MPQPNDDFSFPSKFVDGVTRHINEEHRAAMLLIAHRLLDASWATDAELVAMHKVGFSLRVTTPSREEIRTYAFAIPLSDASDWRPALIKVFQRATAVGR